jgi:hypothetical protein
MGAISTGDVRRNVLRAALALLLALAVVVAVPTPVRADTPVVTASIGAQTFDEGGGLTDVELATFNDVSGPGSYTATVDWGDGTTDVCGVDPCTLIDDLDGTGSVRGTHTYAQDGSFTITVTVDDGVSVPSGGTATIGVTVDNVAPVLTIRDDVSVPEGTTVTLEGGSGTTYTDAGVLDAHTATADWEETGAVGVTAIAGVITGSHLYDDDGLFSVDVVLSDGDGGTTNDQFTVTVTNVDPVLAIRGDATINEGDTVNLTGTSFTDVGAGDGHTATVNWGDGTPTEGAGVSGGDLIASHVYDDDTGSPFTVTVTVTDDDGGFDTETFTVTASNLNPVLSLRGNGTITEGDTVTLAGSGGTTYTDPGAGDTHTATVDWGFGVEAATASGGVVTASNLYADEDGSPFIVPVVLDDGDGGSDSDTFQVTVNNAIPVVTPRGNASVENGATVFLGSSSFTDAGVDDTHSATVNWGDGSPTEVATVSQGAGSGGLSGSHVFSTGGPYTVTLIVTDNDGGASVPATFTVTVSNSPFTVNAGGNQTVDEGDTVSVNAPYNDTDGSGTHTATIDWGDGSPIDNCPADCTITDVAGVGTVTGSHVYPDDNPTAYTVVVTVQDETSDLATDSFDVTVNDVAPTLTLSGNASVNEGGTYTLTIGPITDPGDDSFTEWIVDWGDGTAPQTFGAGGNRDHVYADGLDNVTISIDLFDPSEGLFTDVDTLDITVNNVAPTLALSDLGDVDEGGTFTLVIGLLTDPGDDSVIGDYTIDWGDGTPTQDVAAAPGNITHTYADGDSTPTIEVSVTDEDDTVIAGTLGVTVNNVAPTVAAPATATIIEGGTLGTSISFTDPATTNDSYEARINYGGGFGAWSPVTSPFNLNNVVEDDGPYFVTIEVRDEDGGTGTDTIDVTVTNAAPVVTAGDDVTVPEGTTVLIDDGGPTSFTDAGVNDTHNAAVDWDEGAGFETATVSEGGGSGTVDFPGGHTYDVPGVYTVVVAVSDAADAASFGTDSFTVTVQNLNLIVNAAPDGLMTLGEGDTVSITAGFTDNDGTGSYSATIDWGDGTVADCSTAACNLSGGPGGIGTVTGSHTYPQDGSFTVTVTVFDGGIDVGAGGFTYTVENVVPTTNVTGPATSDEGDRIRLEGNPSDPGADVLSYEWTITKNGDLYQSGTFQSISVRPDDNGAYQAQFIAFDDDGQSAVDTFNWTVVNLDPAAVIVDAETGDPVSGIAEIGEEGSTITLGADVTDPSSLDTFSYEWTISQPGSLPIAGTNPTISFLSPDDGLFFVSLTVTDDDGGSFSPSAPIISVTNADPIFENVVTDPTPAVGATVSLGVFFSDPGSLDTHSMTVDWGDGDTDSIGTATSPESLAHSYPTAGPRLAEVCIEDDDGGNVCATWWYNVGGTLSTAVDYDGDGRGDLAIGVPGEDDGAGGVHVLYGKASGASSDGDQFLRQGIGGVKGAQQPDDAFGSAIAEGDFNGDGYTDIAIGAPEDDQSGRNNSGNVTVIYGSSSGLDVGTDQVWHQDRAGVDDSAEAGDRFGTAVVAGDFNGDAYADLAIGVPYENLGAKTSTGLVTVLFGSPSGLTGTQSQVLHQDVGEISNSNAPDDNYGAALTAGDFNADGFVDLAIGIPGQRISSVLRAGAVNVLFGTPIGLATSGDLFLRPGANGLEGTTDEDDEFGSVLAAGDLTGDGFDDLVVGVPNDDIDGKNDAGTVSVIPGSGSGPSGANDVVFQEGSNGIRGNPARKDRFGASVAVGASNDDAYDDLLVGIPNQRVSGQRQAGTAAFIPGSPTLDGAGDSRWHEDRKGILGDTDRLDHLGEAVALNDITGNGRADVILGIPDQRSQDETRKSVGAVLMIRGGKTRPVPKNNQFLWQGVDGLLDAQHKFDRFGAAF